MDKVTWAMIGCGDVTEVKSGPGFYKSNNSALRGVFNRTKSKADDYAKRHGIPVVYENVYEILEDPEIDAVYIATPPNTHKNYALLCLENGKIPYIEKPLCKTYDDCIEVLEKSKEVKLPVYVAFYRRGMEKYIKIKELLDNNTIGKPLFCQIKQFSPIENNELDPKNLPWRVIPEISGGGKFLDMGVHVLDILDYFFGHIVEANGIATNNGGAYSADDTVSANFQFENGVSGHGMWCFCSDYNEESVTIYGDKGTMTFEALGYGDVTVSTGNNIKTYSFEKPDHVGMPYIQSIVYEILGKEKSNANFDSSCNVVNVMDKILSNYYKNLEATK